MPGVDVSPHAVGYAFATYGERDLGFRSSEAAVILDHMEGVEPTDVTGSFYSSDPQIAWAERAIAADPCSSTAGICLRRSIESDTATSGWSAASRAEKSLACSCGGLLRETPSTWRSRRVMLRSAYERAADPHSSPGSKLDLDRPATGRPDWTRRRAESGITLASRKPMLLPRWHPSGRDETTVAIGAAISARRRIAAPLPSPGAAPVSSPGRSPASHPRTSDAADPYPPLQAARLGHCAYHCP